MTKKLLAVLAVVAAASTAVAFEGPYAGGMVSYDSGKVDIKDSPNRGDLKPKGAGVDLLGGYNHEIADRVYIGLEGFLGYSAMKVAKDGAKVKAPLHMGVAPRLGFSVKDNVLLFAKVGVDYRRFTIKDDVQRSNLKENRLGLLAGAGIEYKFDENIAVRADYSYSQYKLKKTVNNQKNKFPLHRVGLGVSWYF